MRRTSRRNRPPSSQRRPSRADLIAVAHRVITTTRVRHGLVALGDTRHMRDAFEAVVVADFGVCDLRPDTIFGAFLAAADELCHVAETVH